MTLVGVWHVAMVQHGIYPLIGMHVGIHIVFLVKRKMGVPITQIQPAVTMRTPQKQLWCIF